MIPISNEKETLSQEPYISGEYQDKQSCQINRKIGNTSIFECCFVSRCAKEERRIYFGKY